ncbi:hypothetical protein PCE1_001126 [Barthelona sp. PCE]
MATESRVLNFFTANYGIPLDAEVVDLSGLCTSMFLGLEIFTNLKVLNLSGNRLSSLAYMNVPPTLCELDLSGNIIDSLDKMGNLPNIKVINVSNNRLNNFEGLERCTSLEVLIADNNRIRSVDNIAHLKKLHTLKLEYNTIEVATELRSLSYAKGLRSLFLKGCPLANSPTYLVGVHHMCPNVSHIDGRLIRGSQHHHITRSQRDPQQPPVPVQRERRARVVPKRVLEESSRIKNIDSELSDIDSAIEAEQRAIISLDGNINVETERVVEPKFTITPSKIPSRVQKSPVRELSPEKPKYRTAVTQTVEKSLQMPQSTNTNRRRSFRRDENGEGDELLHNARNDYYRRRSSSMTLEVAPPEKKPKMTVFDKVIKEEKKEESFSVEEEVDIEPFGFGERKEDLSVPAFDSDLVPRNALGVLKLLAREITPPIKSPPPLEIEADENDVEVLSSEVNDAVFMSPDDIKGMFRQKLDDERLRRGLDYSMFSPLRGQSD